MSTPIDQKELSRLHEYLNIDYKNSPCTPVQAGFAALAGYEVTSIAIITRVMMYRVRVPEGRDLGEAFSTREKAWKAAYDHLAAQSKAREWTTE